MKKELIRMEASERLPSIETIKLAYQNSYGNSRTVLDVELISTTSKIRKMIIEYLVTYRNSKGEVRKESMIGKVYSDSYKGLTSFRFMQYLWKNGFEQDSQYTMVRPIAYLQTWKLMLMSKAPGKPMDELLHDPNVNLEELGFHVTNWLTKMHSIPLTGVRKLPYTRADADVSRFYQDLIKNIPKYSGRLKDIHEGLIQRKEKLESIETVLLHGDFHTKNLFIHDKNVIAIDFDHHFAGDPAWDVAYLSCQIGLSGFFKKGDFEYFQPVIKDIIERYLLTHSSYNPDSFLERLFIYSARSLFESLHYELCVLNTGNDSIVEPFLNKCERHLQGNDFS